MHTLLGQRVDAIDDTTCVYSRFEHDRVRPCVSVIRCMYDRVVTICMSHVCGLRAMCLRLTADGVTGMVAGVSHPLVVHVGIHVHPVACAHVIFTYR